MSGIEKISVALSSDLLTMVKDAVSSGKYASSSEVVREALREWQIRQPLREAEVERLRRAWAEGIDSGASRPFDIDEIKAKARDRLTAARRAR